MEGKGQGKGKDGAAEKKEEKQPPFTTLNATNFKQEVFQSTDAWMVWFKPAAGACCRGWR